MSVGVQFTGRVPAGGSGRWFTHGWPAHLHVAWNVVPTSPGSGAPQVEWDVEVERASPDQMTYWITVKNVSPVSVDFEARYAVLN